MNYYDVKGTDLKISVLGYGCMNIGQRWDQSVLEEKDIERTKESVMTAFEQGINFLTTLIFILMANLKSLLVSYYMRNHLCGSK